jgi:hypothetical protein
VLRLFALAVLAAAGACSWFDLPAAPDAATSAWSAGPAMPRRALDPGVTALGLELVVAGGFDTGAAAGQDITSRVDVYDTADGTWSRLPDAPVRWTGINLAAIGGTLYLAGGLEGPQRVARGESFALDPIDHVWRALPPMPPGYERGAAGVVTAPGRIYLLGGASSTGAVASCLEFDIATRTWLHLPDLPAPLAHPAAIRRSDGTLIVAGGLASLDASQPRGEVWALPPPAAPQRTWQLRTAPERVARGGCAYGVVLSQLICAGGEGGPAASRLVETYDPYVDAWTEGEPLPVERTGTQGAAIGARLFVPGGAGPLATDPTDTLYIYAPLDTAPR